MSFPVVLVSQQRRRLKQGTSNSIPYAGVSGTSAHCEDGGSDTERETSRPMRYLLAPGSTTVAKYLTVQDPEGTKSERIGGDRRTGPRVSSAGELRVVLAWVDTATTYSYSGLTLPLVNSLTCGVPLVPALSRLTYECVVSITTSNDSIRFTGACHSSLLLYTATGPFEAYQEDTLSKGTEDKKRTKRAAWRPPPPPIFAIPVKGTGRDTRPSSKNQQLHQSTRYRYGNNTPMSIHQALHYGLRTYATTSAIH
ncbi:hypothetical protein B0T10DRAFT_458767 [Thelonectria olida]|uniref:Uncharacterized protein n=1 Tax=Thelonectria olida TaxID=1576542 RepID=A0A9P8W7M8_9HYPO|nr:hypothetical protein B0T10DRAFT_458767 [Thelonectria olida]